MVSREVVRFLIAGGSAAAINWLARIPLSLILSFEAALVAAYAVGMVAGFWLYRVFVFRGAARGSLREQLPLFLAVNACGVGVVLAVSTLAVAALGGLLPGLGPTVAEALGHGLGVGAGAVANYLGHRLLTFGAALRAAPQPQSGLDPLTASSDGT